jgi:general secretion pathway protein D
VLNTIEYEDIGIILTVTPHITDDGMVELDVAPEISTLTGESVTISEGVEAPTFAKRSAETRVLVPDGRTVVIGGLMSDEETEIVRKVPVLGSIWGLGALFRRTITEKTKTELLIFLTPHVVRTGEEVTGLTRSERAASPLSSETFDSETLERYMTPEARE